MRVFLCLLTSLLMVPMVLAGEPSSGDVMVAVKSGDWLTVVVYALAIVWALLQGSKRLTDWRLAQVKVAEGADNAMVRAKAIMKAKLVDLMRGVCAEVYADYYRDIKEKAKDGTISKDEQSEAKKTARDMAVGKAVAIAKAEGMDLAKEFGMPLLHATAEQAVSWLKNRYANK